MIGYITIGTNDLKTSVAFYDAAFEPLGYARTFEGGGWAGYGPAGKKEGLEIYLATPENGKPATFGNGSMLALKARDRATVEAFHAAALKAGGTDEGNPVYAARARRRSTARTSAIPSATSSAPTSRGSGEPARRIASLAGTSRARGGSRPTVGEAC